MMLVFLFDIVRFVAVIGLVYLVLRGWIYD